MGWLELGVPILALLTTVYMSLVRPKLKAVRSRREREAAAPGRRRATWRALRWA